MSPIAKKVLTAVAVKKAIDKVQEMRKPKPPVKARLGKAALIAAAGGGIAYLAKTGRLQALLGKVKGGSTPAPQSSSVRIPESPGPLTAPTPPLGNESSQQAPTPVH